MEISILCVGSIRLVINSICTVIIVDRAVVKVTLQGRHSKPMSHMRALIFHFYRARRKGREKKPSCRVEVCDELHNKSSKMYSSVHVSIS